MKVAILGYARDGKAAYDYWNHDGNEITVCDQNNQLQIPLSAKSKLGPDYLKKLGQFDLLVRTAGLRPKDIADANPEMPSILDKITTNTDEFLKVCPSKNVIGVTGTKGKGTASTLVAKMLEADSKKVHLGGNIGIPALELLKNNIQPDDWVVLELGAFQLIDQKHSTHIAICLMIAQEHMDWYDNMADYIESKKQLFIHQKPEDIAIYLDGDDNSKQIANSGPAKKIPYYATPGSFIDNDEIKIDGQTICKTYELKLLGEHNWQNVCAAVTAVWQVTKNVEAIRSVLTTFSGLEHRLELVREVKGVKYYDDSFGTTPETAIVAIKAFKDPKVVILGGSDKGSSYTELAQTVKNNVVKKVILIGKMGPTIKSKLESAGFHDIVEGGDTMEQIVSAAQSQAQPGDIVLLSTACASFDMFKDYIDRGEQFKKAVQALA